MEALEQVLETVPSFGPAQLYGTIDQQAILCCGPLDSPFQPTIKQTDIGFIVPHPPQTEIRDWHDTYKFDRYNNPYGGHTAFDVPGYPKQRIDHGNDFNLR